MLADGVEARAPGGQYDSEARSSTSPAIASYSTNTTHTQTEARYPRPEILEIEGGQQDEARPKRTKRKRHSKVKQPVNPKIQELLKLYYGEPTA